MKIYTPELQGLPNSAFRSLNSFLDQNTPPITRYSYFIIVFVLSHVSVKVPLVLAKLLAIFVECLQSFVATVLQHSFLGLDVVTLILQPSLYPRKRSLCHLKLSSSSIQYPSLKSHSGGLNENLWPSIQQMKRKEFIKEPTCCP